MWLAEAAGALHQSWWQQRLLFIQLELAVQV
jgi:hypothetical protein